MKPAYLAVFFVALLLGLPACQDSDSDEGFHTLEYLKILCAWSTACEGWDMEKCLDEATNDDLSVDAVHRGDALRKTTACMLAAGSCEAAEACRNPSCKELDCEARGLTCNQLSSDWTYCGIPGLSCSTLYGEETCQDGMMTLCTEGMSNDKLPPMAFFCTDAGKVCTEDGYCADPGAGCEADQEYLSCDGHQMVYCLDNGSRATYDCRIVDPDFVCEMLSFKYENDQPTCQMPTDKRECQPEDTPRCDGNVVKGCAAGKWATVDCATVGALCVAGSCRFPETE